MGSQKSVVYQKAGSPIETMYERVFFF